MPSLSELYLTYLVLFLILHTILEVIGRGVLALSEDLGGEPSCPPLTLVKPVHGVNAFKEECLVSWLTQEYPGELQVIFSLQDAEDPALALLEELAARPDLRPFEVVVNPIEPGFHGKGSNLLHGVRAAEHELLVLSDDDIVAPPGTLVRIATELANGRELVSCPVLHDRAVDLWGRVYASLWNYIIVYVVGPQLALGTGTMVAGGTIGIRAEALERIGGIEAYGRYLTDDMELGIQAWRHGLDRGLGPVVRSPVGDLGRAGWDEKVERCVVAKTQVPWGSLATLGWATCYGYLPALVLFAVTANLSLLAATLGWIACRGVFCGMIEAKSTGRFRYSLDFLPLEATLATALVTALIRSPAQCTWGGETYRFDRGRVVGSSGSVVPAI